jgi:Ca2+-binding EF-hand superfamily protein
MGQGPSVEVAGMSDEEVRRMSRRFKRLANNEETLPVSVLETELRGIPFARSILSLYDANGDGKLTESECIKAVSAMLSTASEEKKMQSEC